MKKVLLALLIPAVLGQWGCGSAKPVAMETGPYANNQPSTPVSPAGSVGATGTPGAVVAGPEVTVPLAP